MIPARLRSLNTVVASALVLVTLPVSRGSSPPQNQSQKTPASGIRIAGVVEPPELTGEPAVVKEVSTSEGRIDNIAQTDWNDPEKVKSVSEELSEIITLLPDYSDAYFLRATARCSLNSGDHSGISGDIVAAIKYYPRHDNRYSLTAMIEMKSKVEYAAGHYRAAIEDLEEVLRLDLSYPGIFANAALGGPERSDPCSWSQSDVDALKKQVPNDYRVHLYEGLFKYALAIGSSDQKASYESALIDVKRAITVNPRSALSYYIAGRLYSWIAFWGLSPDEKLRNNRAAVERYSHAFQLEEKLLPAYTDRASAYYESKQYRQAIADYDKVLEADPNNSDAYYWRDKAKGELGIPTPAPTIKELTQNIHRLLSIDIPLMNIAQFRAIYPEYHSVSDDIVTQKLQRLFYPQSWGGALARMFMGEEWFEDAMLPELYVDRGDYYLSSGDYGKALVEYRRATKGFPNYAGVVERWRSLGALPGGESYYVDINTMEFPATGPTRLWLKAVGKKPTHTVDAYEVDCKRRRINHPSSVVYDSDGNVVRRSDESSGWQRIIPDTIGEQLYNGMCLVGR